MTSWDPSGQPPYGQQPPNEQPPQYPQQPPYPQAPYGQQPYGQMPAPPYGQQPYNPYPQQQSTNGFAIASLVMSFLVSLLGLIFGIVALRQINRTGQKGRGLAIAGIMLSVFFMIIAVIVVVNNNA